MICFDRRIGDRLDPQHALKFGREEEPRAALHSPLPVALFRRRFCVCGTFAVARHAGNAGLFATQRPAHASSVPNSTFSAVLHPVDADHDDALIRVICRIDTPLSRAVCDDECSSHARLESWFDHCTKIHTLPLQARRRCAVRVPPWTATHICSAITSLSNELVSAERLLLAPIQGE